jgi:excinuclease ABC subunit C
MREAAGALRFEDAARLRDQLGAVERSLEKQRVLMADEADRDVFGLYREGPDLALAVLSVRGGKLQDARTYPFARQEFPDEEIVSSFLALYYEQNPAPEEVLLPLEVEGAWALAEVLSDRRGRKVKLLTPQRGAKADLLEVAARNAAQGFKSWHERDERRDEALAALTRALHLAKEPRWAECYDISTFQGALAVGSGVSMKDGEPDKGNYRRYKVKGVTGQDDFAMLHEVIGRRLKRAVAEGSFPDLLVIDGGKGQLQAALAAAADLGIPTRPVPGNEGAPFVEMVGLAKSRIVDTANVVSGRRPWTTRPRRDARRERSPEPPAADPGLVPAAAAEQLADAAEGARRGFVSEIERTPERVFLSGRKDPVVLRQNSAELYLLTRLRDEAHRFAITFHRQLRRGRNFLSVLEEIPGVGAGRRKALLRTLGSLKRVKEASLAELAAVEGFGPRAAAAVWEFFHPPAGAPSPELPEEAGPTEAEIDSALAAEDPALAGEAGAQAEAGGEGAGAVPEPGYVPPAREGSEGTP